MKKIIYILSIFLATGFISCDNFLDITPVGKVIPTTATEFRALVFISKNGLGMIIVPTILLILVGGNITKPFSSSTIQ